MAGLRVYRDLLGNRPLVRLLLGEFVSGIGDWLYMVGMLIAVLISCVMTYVGLHLGRVMQRVNR